MERRLGERGEEVRAENDMGGRGEGGGTCAGLHKWDLTTGIRNLGGAWHARARSAPRVAGRA